MKNLLFIQLNEINFDLALPYIEKLNLEGLKKLLKLNKTITSSEEKYELLEPWIQWHSIHTGLSADEHKLFRLGDANLCSHKTIYEIVESSGFKIGVMSAMNITNNFKNPSFFIPDPWTETTSGNSFWEKKISGFLNQSVNNNVTNEISLKNYFYILLALIFFGRFKNYIKYFSLALSSSKKPWRKALFLDLLLSDIFLKLSSKNKVNLSSLFLNAGAHIQHHYFFNSSAKIQKNDKQKNPSWYISEKYDPFEEMLKIYDGIVEDFFLTDKKQLLFATGLTQEFDDEAVFYYRPKNHENFLKKLGINFKKVLPRMSRDFLIEFFSESEAIKAENLLNSIELNNQKLFLEPDNRGKTLFVSIGYGREILENDFVLSNDKEIKLKNELSFVAIKNGKHSSKGFLFLTDELLNNGKINRSETINVKDIYKIIADYFKIALKN